VGRGGLAEEAAALVKRLLMFHSGEVSQSAASMFVFAGQKQRALHLGAKPLVCAKTPYAACMTAPCKQRAGENHVCSCPVFDGVFQLPTPGAACNPGDDLIPSSSFSAKLLNP
jgi:hypothetical protein